MRERAAVKANQHTMMHVGTPAIWTPRQPTDLTGSRMTRLITPVSPSRNRGLITITTKSAHQQIPSTATSTGLNPVASIIPDRRAGAETSNRFAEPDAKSRGALLT